MALIDSKISNQRDFLFERATFRRNPDVRSKADRPDNRRPRLLDEQAQHVLDAAMADVQIERGNFTSRAGLLFDTSSDQHVRSYDHSFHMLQGLQLSRSDSRWAFCAPPGGA